MIFFIVSGHLFLPGKRRGQHVSLVGLHYLKGECKGKTGQRLTNKQKTRVSGAKTSPSLVIPNKSFPAPTPDINSRGIM
jgi:hypothetical protein